MPDGQKPTLANPAAGRRAGGRILLLPGPCAQSVEGGQCSEARCLLRSRRTRPIAAAGECPNCRKFPSRRQLVSDRPFIWDRIQEPWPVERFRPQRGLCLAERLPELPRNTYRSIQVWRTSERPAWRPGYAASARWRRSHRALCRAGEYLSLQLCKSGSRSEWRSAARSRPTSGPLLRPGWGASWYGAPCPAEWGAWL